MTDQSKYSDKHIIKDKRKKKVHKNNIEKKKKER